MIEGISLMIKGMCGIFIVVGALYVAMKILGTIDKKK